MNQDYIKAVALLIEMIVSNNAGCVARKLKELGKDIKDFVPAYELKSQLFMLHAADINVFYDVMRGCEWNKGNTNWTNDNKILAQVIEAVNVHTGTQADRTNWWIVSLNYLEKRAKQ